MRTEVGLEHADSTPSRIRCQLIFFCPSAGSSTDRAADFGSDEVTCDLSHPAPLSTTEPPIYRRPGSVDAATSVLGGARWGWNGVPPVSHGKEM